MGISFDPVALFERRIEAVRKAGSIDEYSAIVDELLECVKEFQKETTMLEEEVKQLKDTKEREDRVERHKGTYITLKGNSIKLIYCSVCWDKDRTLIQMRFDKNDGVYRCFVCGQWALVRG